MDDEVRIAADRAREMGVHLGREAEVAEVLLVVAGELHRPQQEVGDELLLRLALDLAEDELEVLRPDGLEMRGHAVAERGHQLGELLDALGIGLLVDAEERGHAGLGQPGRHRLVGREHELLDEPHAVQPLGGHDAGHLPRGAEHELGLREVEVERPALVAPLAHELGQLVHVLQHADERAVAPALRGVAVDDGLDLRIGEAGRAADHAVVELGLPHLALGVQLQDRALGQAVLALDQAADVAGERVRQHRHDPVREVDRRAADVGFLIEQRPRPHVMRHVRDVHREAPVPVRQALDRHGVVVVARGLGIDGDGRPRAEVGPAPDLGLPDLPRHALGFRFDLRREGVGELVLGHDDLEVHAGILEPAEHLQHAPGRAPRGGGRPRDLGRDHLARPGPLVVAGSDRQLVEDPLVERHHVASEAPVFFVAADDPLQAPLQHADDAALGTFRRVALDARHHPVAVERLLHVDRRDVDVASAAPGLLRDHEAVTGRVAGEPAHHEVHARRQAHAPPADFHDLAVDDEAAQEVRQLGTGVLVEVQAPDELPHGDRLPFVGKDGEDVVSERSQR